MGQEIEYRKRGNLKDITKPHLDRIFRKDGDDEVKGEMVDIVLGKNSLSEAIKKWRKNSE